MDPKDDQNQDIEEVNEEEHPDREVEHNDDGPEYPRPTTEEECAHFLNYEYLSENRYTGRCRQVQEQQLRKFFQHCVGQDLQPKQCGCPIINNRRCTNMDCYNRNNYTACPDSCHPNCDNNPWARNSFVFGRSTYLKRVGERGHGIFAHKNIPKGTYIGELTGVVKRESVRLPRRNREYLMEISDMPLIIDPTDHGSGVSRINHACFPNCESRIIIHGGAFKIIVVAIKDIQKDKELTIDYHWKHKSLKDAPVCLCGHKKCKKIIGTLINSQKKTKASRFTDPKPKWVASTLKKKVNTSESSADCDPQDENVENLPRPFARIEHNAPTQLQRLASSQIQTRRRPDDYAEDHIFNPLDNVFAVIPENGSLAITGAVVVECYINAHGIPIYVVRRMAPGTIEYHLPRWVLFHHHEDAVFRRDYMFSENDRQFLTDYATPHANAEMGEGLSYDLVADYAARFNNNDIPDTEMQRSPVAGAVALGYPLYYLEPVEPPEDHYPPKQVARKNAQGKQPKKENQPTSQNTPNQDIQLDFSESSEGSDAESPTASNTCKVVISQPPATYNVNQRLDLNDLLNVVTPDVMLRRHFENAVEQVSILAYARLPPDFSITYPELYNLVRTDLENLYYWNDPSERRFLRYNHYKTATEAMSPGSIDLNWCSLCRRSHTFANAKLRNRHFHLCHSIIAPVYICPKCKKVFNYPTEFRDHLWVCDPVTAADLRTDVMPFILDALADYIQLRSGSHQTHILAPGLPLMKQITGEQDSHKTGCSSTGASVEMNIRTGRPLNNPSYCNPFEWQVQKRCTEINSWDDLQPATSIDPQSQPPLQFPQRASHRQASGPHIANISQLPNEPEEDDEESSVPEPLAPTKKRSRQKVREEKDRQCENEQVPSTSGRSIQPRVVKKASKPRIQKPAAGTAVSTSSGRTNPSRLAKQKAEQKTKKIQELETSKVSAPSKSTKAGCKKPSKKPTPVSSDDEDISMFDPNASGTEDDSTDEEKGRKFRRTK